MVRELRARDFAASNLLGQRADGELVQQLQERAGAWHSLRTARSKPPLLNTSRFCTTENGRFDPRLQVAQAVHGRVWLCRQYQEKLVA